VQNLSKNKIKWIRSLQLKKNRDSFKVFVIEGDKMIQEAMTFAASSIELICITKTSNLSDDNTFKNIENYLISDEELKSISSLKNPNKSIAIIKNEYKSLSPSALKIAIDGVQDPGNMGTILRLADWYGITEIICSTETVDCYNPKVIQASMGAIFRVKVKYVELATFLSKQSKVIYGALLNGENVYRKTLVPEGILVLGNEGHGISKEIENLITSPLTIPKIGQTESLNVSTATGILLSEFYRNQLKEI
jgi:RNA methyltransferase, TrmH family